jgi:hypothetical protein
MNKNIPKNIPNKIYIIFILIYGNLFLGWSFQNLTILGIPINETVLLLLLISINVPNIIKHLRLVVNISLFIIWLIYGSFHLVIGFIESGIWALRDGSHVIDSFFLFIGFFLISNEKYYNYFFTHIKKIVLVALLYCLLLPFSQSIQSLIPSVSGAAGYNVGKSLFNYSSMATTWVWLAFYTSINYTKINNSFLYTKVIPFLFLIVPIILFQQRSTYLSIFGLMFFLLLFAREKFTSKFLSYICIFIITLFIFSLFDFELKGRISNFSAEFLFEHIMSTFGYASERTLGSSGTVDQRLIWLMEVIDNSFNSITRFIFGKGFGEPLIEFGATQGVIVREPHNAFLSIYGKMGLFGFIIWFCMHINFLIVWRRFYQYAKLNNKSEEKNYLLGLIIFIIIILLSGTTNSNFEQTYTASIYYMFWGIILRICYNLSIYNLENYKNN